MDAIQKIIGKINEQAQAERQEFEKNRLAEIDTNFLVEQRKIMQEHEQQLVKQTEQMQKRFQQQKNRLEVENRQEILKKKQAYLEKLFEEAHTEMTQWTLAQHRTFAEVVLAKLAITKGVFIPGGLVENGTYPKEWLEEVANKQNKKLTLASPSAVLEYGFLIEHEGVQYNFLYRDLLTEERRNKGREFMQVLFS
ncbi:hypothetical protein [Enterococcus lemanii]|uniref:ATPase V n=1 Tax=Enterococcus lemanii TaxID=1159752 RepID=A0ABV9MYC5_9ENTE|nr:hypothetical protein [Enterococcus lemanii]MBM7709614.1 V/A-type H+-transporting ATPase subunit E [Enterococcus lemanii]NLM68349.1 hypothetical protein [Enterococcus sp.]